MIRKKIDKTRKKFAKCWVIIPTLIPIERFGNSVPINVEANINKNDVKNANDFFCSNL